MARDPICGMTVDETRAIKVTKDNRDYFFCGIHCRDAFLKQESLNDSLSCHSKKEFFKNNLVIVSIISILLLLVSLFIPLLVPFRKAFLMYVQTIWRAVILGLFFGGIVDYYVPRQYFAKFLGGNRPAVIFNAVLSGFLMSVCSHGILALAIQLHKKGVSNPAIVSFLLASPWANFTITVMLITLFGLKGIFIIIAALIIAINTGFIFMFLDKKGLIEKNAFIIEAPEKFSILADLRGRVKNYEFSLKALITGLKGVIKGAWLLSDMVLWWIILGILISSLSSAYIPRDFFWRFMGPSLFGLLVTVGLATVIEVCSEGSSPLAFEIYRQTGALGNSFAFLMAGVVTDYTEIGLLWFNVGKRVAVWLPIITVPQVIILAYIANIVFKTG
ncbi:MAG: permease [Candidatus Omnitrophota bacterium]